jgi:glycosyltransferase involved in cell wall biosynthesis
MPFYDDAAACEQLLSKLDACVRGMDRPTDVLIVNDGSTVSPSVDAARLTSISSITELRLRRSLGHQRAIAVGLAYLESKGGTGPVAVMDSDGEDNPEDLAHLLDEFERAGEKEIVFAERVRRTEGPVFKTLYMFYRKLHHLLTGHRVRVGNFSVMPRSALRALVVVPEIWNHFAAAIFVSRLPYRSVPCPRGHRLAGKSKMNLVSLVMHGLSAISVFSDVVSVRILLTMFVLVSGLLLTLAALLATHIVSLSGRPLPTAAMLMLFGLVAGGLMLLMVLTFLVLGQRKHAITLIARDFVYYIDNERQLYPSPA